jgi:hypothetical protein
MAFTEEQLRHALIQPQEGDGMGIRNTPGGAWDCEHDRPYKNPPACDTVADSYYPENFNGKVRSHAYLGGSIGAGSETCAPVPPSEISEAVGRTNNTLDRLAKAIAALESRLTPVLRAEGPQKECTSPTEVTTCALHDALVSIERRVLLAARVLEAMEQRLAL